MRFSKVPKTFRARKVARTAPENIYSSFSKPTRAPEKIFRDLFPRDKMTRLEDMKDKESELNSRGLIDKLQNKL